MKTTENTTYYYLVKRYADGRIWYEGYSDEQAAHEYMEKANAFHEACGDPERLEYVGTSLPADVVQYAHLKEMEFEEQEFLLPNLQGSEKQIGWARDIRFRYVEYLQDRKGIDGAKVALQAQPARPEAQWWINNRYALGVTTKDSHFIAEGR